MTVRELLFAVKALYREKGGEEFFSEKELLRAVFEKNGLDPALPLTDPKKIVGEKTAETLLGDARRLSEGEPLQYYLGTAFFDGREFLCEEGVLIPREDTEALVDEGEESLPENGLFFDFCCGSGCVGIALLLRRRDAVCQSFDLSEKALSLTEKNRARFGLEGRLTARKCDVFSPEAEEMLQKEKPRLVLANPPYITDSEMLLLPENVRREPEIALRGGADGLDFYRRFLFLAKKTGIPFAFEIGKGQEKILIPLAEKQGFFVSFRRDGRGIARVLKIEQKK